MGEWRKSSYSGGNNDCVEVALLPAGVGVRDTKNRGSGHLSVPARQWRAFIGGVKRDAL